jgi:hypothetical protein
VSLGILTLSIHGIMAFLLALGGLYALNRGFHLFVTGIGDKKDEAAIAFGKFTATSKSVGSFVMITACVWGLFSYLTVPALKTDAATITSLFDTKRTEYVALVGSIDSCIDTIQSIIDAPPPDAGTLLPLGTQGAWGGAPGALYLSIENAASAIEPRMDQPTADKLRNAVNTLIDDCQDLESRFVANKITPDESKESLRKLKSERDAIRMLVYHSLFA